MTDRKSGRGNNGLPRKEKRQQIRNVPRYTEGNKKIVRLRKRTDVLKSE
jgi:hypothetical protein